MNRKLAIAFFAIIGVIGFLLGCDENESRGLLAFTIEKLFAVMLIGLSVYGMQKLDGKGKEE